MSRWAKFLTDPSAGSGFGHFEPMHDVGGFAVGLLEGAELRQQGIRGGAQTGEEGGAAKKESENSRQSASL